MTGIIQAVITASTSTHGTATFSYTGADQTWTVPSGITKITVTVRGASGGNVSTATGGAGATVSTTVSVTPGDTLRLVVGAKGGDGSLGGITNPTCPYGGGGAGGGGAGGSAYSGSAGGGYSGIFVGNSISVANALVIAGGGAGAGVFSGTNANGGAAGTSGNASDGVNGSGSYGHVGGYGATTSANGAAGTPFDSQSVNPVAGTQLNGGTGGQVTGATWAGGGGGGAGYYSGGGGAGGGAAIGGGGGGTSYILSGTNTSYASNTGNGSISIVY